MCLKLQISSFELEKIFRYLKHPIEKIAVKFDELPRRVEY